MKQRLRALLGQVVWTLASALLATIAVGRLGRRRDSDASAPRSVLIVRFDLLGDVVNGLAAAQAARRAWPLARVTFMAPPAWQPVVARCSAVDAVIAHDAAAVTHWPGVLDPRCWAETLRTLREIRAASFDVAVAVYGPIAGTVVGLSGARRRIGYGREAPAFAFDEPRPGGRANGGPHESVLAAGLIGPDPPEWQTVNRVGGLPEVAALDNVDRPLVVAHGGAAHGRAKRWPDAHWIESLATIQKRHGATIAIVGLADEHPFAERVAHAIPGTIDLTGRTDLEALMQVLHQADLVISTDSGPAHLARALGTRVVALHGPTDVHIHGPGGPMATALRVELPCGPCYTFRAPASCSFGDVLCMQWLTPERVTAAATAVLAPASRAP